MSNITLEEFIKLGNLRYVIKHYEEMNVEWDDLEDYIDAYGDQLD